MTAFFITADLFSAGHSLVSKLGGLLGFALILGVGLLALKLLFEHKIGAMIILLIVAIIPAYFFLDPNGATSLLKSTVSGLH